MVPKRAGAGDPKDRKGHKRSLKKQKHKIFQTRRPEVMTVSVGLTVSHKTAKILAVRRKIERILTASRKKMLTLKKSKHKIDLLLSLMRFALCIIWSTMGKKMWQSTHTDRPTVRLHHRHTKAKFGVVCGEGFLARKQMATRVL